VTQAILPAPADGVELHHAAGRHTASHRVNVATRGRLDFASRPKVCVQSAHWYAFNCHGADPRWQPVGSLAYVVSVGEYFVALPRRHKVEVPALPQKWMRVRSGTPPELERFVDNPGGLKEYVEDVLRRAQQFQDAPIELIEVYFEVGRPVAYVLVKDLDDPITVKAVCRILGAEGFTELLTADQAKAAIERELAIRGEPEPDSTSSTS
jgi:hypothetical protein